MKLLQAQSQFFDALDSFKEEVEKRWGYCNVVGEMGKVSRIFVGWSSRDTRQIYVGDVRVILRGSKLDEMEEHLRSLL